MVHSQIKSVRNTIKSKFTYNGRKIAFDGEGSWSFGNDFDSNVVIFGFDNTLSSHAENRKNTFLVLCEGPVEGINDSTGLVQQKKQISI